MNKINKVTTRFQSSVKGSGHKSALISLLLESPEGSEPGSALSRALIAASSFQQLVSLAQTGDLSPLGAKHCNPQPLSASFSLPGFFSSGDGSFLYAKLSSLRQEGKEVKDKNSGAKLLGSTTHHSCVASSKQGKLSHPDTLSHQMCAAGGIFIS